MQKITGRNYECRIVVLMGSFASVRRKFLLRSSFYFAFFLQQRPTDQMFVGELYVDRDFEDGKLKGCSCRFNLGTKRAVEKYIQVGVCSCCLYFIPIFVAWTLRSIHLNFWTKFFRGFGHVMCNHVFCFPSKQFTEIVTEEGRRPVKITHQVPGQAAKICSTPGKFVFDLWWNLEGK